MRIARDKDELGRTFEQSVLEAKEAFGDGTLYLEIFRRKCASRRSASARRWLRGNAALWRARLHASAVIKR